MAHATLLGPENCVDVTGLPWRRVREIAARMGVRRIRCGRATLVPLAEFRAALEAAEQPAQSADDAQSVREALRARRAGEAA